MSRVGHIGMDLAAHILLPRKGGSSCKPDQKGCRPATKKETMIIAISFGVFLALMIVLVIWWYRCTCCCSRRDKRTWNEALNEGVDGWLNGGKRPANPKKANQGFEQLPGDDVEAAAAISDPSATEKPGKKPKPPRQYKDNTSTIYQIGAVLTAIAGALEAFK